MTISEQSRHAMFLQLESVLGQEAALILMEHLPPVGWADVATKRDLDHLHTLMQRDLALGLAGLGGDLRGEMSQLSERMFDRMTAQTRTLVIVVLGAVATMAGVTLSAVRLG